MASWQTKLSVWKPPYQAGKRRWLAVLTLALLAAAGFTYYSYQQGAAPAQSAGSAGKGAAGKNRPMPVLAEPAQLGELRISLGALGTVTPRNTVTVKSRVDGQLMRLAFREGQTIKAGELLAEIDPRPFQVQVTQAEGQFAKDQALLTNARVDLERYRQLYAQEALAKQQLDTQEALVRQYEGLLKVDQGQLDNAKLQHSYTRITAPVAGRLGLRQVDPGNLIRSSDANGLVVLTQEKPITAIFSLPEDHIGAVMQGLQGKHPLRVEAYDREQKRKLATGSLLTADNQIDSSTGTIRLKAQFANDDGALFPNQFVNIKLLLDTIANATLIPSAAIQRGAQGTFVYVVKDDQTVTVRPVKLGPVEGERTAINEGLAAGELVVVDGADKLREGSKVDLASRTKTKNSAKDPAKSGADKARGQPGGKRQRSAE